MGIGSRAYMQSRPPSSGWPSSTHCTLAVLFFVFFVSLVEAATHSQWLGWMRLDESNPRFWQWLTYGFIHVQFWHIIGNGLALWWLGKDVEDSEGKSIYWITLIGGILTGALIWRLTGIGNPEPTFSLGGISGGVCALMLVALAKQLERGITLLIFFIIPVTFRARWVLIVSIAFSFLGWIFNELPDRHNWQFWRPVFFDGVAHSAHLGGFLFGWLMWIYRQQTNRLRGDALRLVDKISPNFGTKNNFSEFNPSQARAELDQLLDKISAEGFGSLTPKEKDRLRDLSDRLR
jgi:membrane associated rhomboid family serine protease